MPKSFQKRSENQVMTKSILDFWCNSKNKNNRRDMTFSPYVNISFFYTPYNFRKYFDSF